MLSVEKCKRIDPTLGTSSDEEILEICVSLYELGQIAFDVWYEEKFDSKNPLGLLVNNVDNNKIELCKRMKEKQE